MFINNKIGIDIGKDSIKVVESAPSLYGPIIKEAKRYKIHYDELGNSTPQDVLKVLKEIIPQYINKEINVSLTHDFIFIKTIALTNTNKPLEKIKQEINNTFPKAETELITTHQIRNKYNAKLKNALCLGINKSFYTKNQEIIAYLKDKVTSLTVAPIAETKSFAYFKKSAAEQYQTAAIVNIGASNTTITIIDHNQLIYYRILADKGSFKLSNQLSQTMHTSFKEAELLKRTEISDKTILAIMDAYIIDIASDLNHTIEAFKAQTNITPEKIFLTGGGSILKNLTSLLNQRLSIPVVPLKIPRKNFKKIDKVADPSATFFTAIGLSLKKPTMTLPLSLTIQKSITKTITRSLTYMFISLLILCCLLHFNLSLTFNNLTKQNDSINQQMQLILQKTFPTNKIVEPYLQMKQLFNLYYKSHQPLTILNLLKEIQSSMPDNVNLYLNTIELKEKRINLTGTSDSYSDIEAFKEKIKESILFQDITFRTNREHKNKITFYMQMSVEM